MYKYGINYKRRFMPYMCDNNTITNLQLIDYAKMPKFGYIRICTNVIYLDFAESL